MSSAAASAVIALLSAAALAQAPALLEDACRRKAPLLTYVNVEPIIRHVLHHEACRPVLRRYGLLI
jgi:hypothetical protein